MLLAVGGLAGYGLVLPQNPSYLSVMERTEYTCKANLVSQGRERLNNTRIVELTVRKSSQRANPGCEF